MNPGYSDDYLLPEPVSRRVEPMTNVKLKAAGKAVLKYVAVIPFLVLGVMDAGDRSMQVVAGYMTTAIDDKFSDIDRRIQIVDDTAAAVQQQQSAQDYAAQALAIADYETGKSQRCEAALEKTQSSLDAAIEQIKRLEAQHEADVAKAEWSASYILECERRLRQYNIKLPGKDS